jgi:hypothetical protein
MLGSWRTSESSIGKGPRSRGTINNLVSCTVRSTYIGDRAEAEAATGGRALRGGRGRKGDGTCDQRGRSNILRYSMGKQNS